MRIVRVFLFVLAILVGIAAGLYFAWNMNPPGPKESSLSALREDYRTDYVLMVAEVYQSEGSIPLAITRLAGLGTDSPSRLTQQAILKARELNYSNADVETLARLSQAMLTWTAQQTGATP
jgi:hypothetical protein